jgi:flagellar hook-associated protein 3 FlgL
MRITGNMVTTGLLSELQNLQTQQSQLQSEVSSGLAITQPSDNPAAFGQTVELESQSRQLAQYQKNANAALNVATASYAGLSSLQSIYDRASQLGTLGTTVTGASTSQAYGAELDQLIQQAVQVANSEVGGQYLFGGTAVSAPPYTATTNSSGAITAVTYVGNSNQASIPLSDSSSVTPGTTGTTNQGIATFLNAMITLRDALNSGNTSTISTANQALLSSEDTITGAVAENGAVQARIQSDQTQQQSESTELNNLISSNTNADIPSTIVKLNQAQLAYQAALQTSASVMRLSILNYITLQ